MPGSPAFQPAVSRSERFTLFKQDRGNIYALLFIFSKKSPVFGL